jgi:hypothetical protein
MRQTYFAIIIATLCFFQANSQVLNGVIEGTTTTLARVTDTKCDSWGNRVCVGYVIGTSQDQVDFDPDPDVVVYVSANSLFLSKYSPDGELIFVREFVQIGSGPSYPQVELLDDGRIIVTGNAGLTDFDPGPGAQYHPEINGPSAFVSIYDHMGRFILLRSLLPQAGNSSSVVVSESMEVYQDEILIAGRFIGSIDFNPLSGTDLQSGSGLFVTRLGTNGDYIRTDALYSVASDDHSITDIVVTESGSAIVFGRFKDNIDLDPGAGEFLLTGPNCQGNGMANFVCKLARNGEFISGGQFISSECGSITNFMLAFVKAGHVFIYAHNSNSAFDLDPGTGTAYMGLGHAILKLDTSLNYIEHHITVGNGEQVRSDFCLTDNGFAITGFSPQTSTLDYTIGGNVDLLPSGTGFLLQYDDNYNFINAVVGVGVYEHSQGVAFNKYFDRLEVNWPASGGLFLKDESGNEIENFSSSTKNQALLSFSANYNLFSGGVFLDTDNSGTVTVTDEKLPNVLVRSLDDSGNSRYSVSNSDGNYFNYLDAGAFSTSASIPFQTSYWYMVPSVINQVFTGYSNYDTTNNFLMTYDIPVTDVMVSAFNTIGVRINSDVGHKILCSNIGTQIETVSIQWTADPGYSLVSSDYPYTVNGSTVTWSQIELEAFETVEIVAVFHNTAGTGNVVTNTIVAIPIGTDVDNSNNTYVIENTVIGSYDPNDKQVFPRESLSLQEATDGRFLDYLVRFQNTGNDTAFNIYILDTISEWLEVGSFQVLDASDDYHVTFLDSNVVEFRFTNILLPDSTVDEPNSHGHIAYRIKSLGGLSYSDTIYNGASIFFDYNDPVLTNYTKNYVELVTNSAERKESEVRVYPNPNTGLFQLILSDLAECDVQVFNALGQSVFSKQFNSSDRVSIELPTSGVYNLMVRSDKGIYTEKVVVQ